MQAQRGSTNSGESNPYYRIAVLSVLSLLIGLITGVAALLFVDSVTWLNKLLLISPRARIQYESQPWLVGMATILVPTIGGLLVGFIIQKFVDERRPLGPPDIIRSVQLREELPAVRSGLFSTAASIVSLGFGASVGQYGPLVYLGALIGSACNRLRLAVPNLKSIVLACGVSAAIATAFNAPIAGLVFAHEVILRHYSIQAFAPTTVAAASGYIVANVVFDRPPLFLVHFAGVDYGYEFALFALLGVFCALLAMLFMRAVIMAGGIAARLPLHARFKPALAGLAVGITAMWIPDVLGIGQEALRFATIEGAYAPEELFILVTAKILLTALCIGFGFAGGVFSPSLLIGILTGALFWTAISLIDPFPVSGVAVYAICGMTALASPVIGAPLTAILIVFELTHNYDLTISAMVAVVFSNLVGYRIFGRSLFDVQLAKGGIDLSLGRDKAQLKSTPVSSLIENEYLAGNLDDSAELVRTRLLESEWSEMFITDSSDNTFVGTIRPVRWISHQAVTAADLLSAATLTFDENTSIWTAMQSLEGFVGDAIPVVDSGSNRLMGVVTEAAIITAYLKIEQSLREEENASA